MKKDTIILIHELFCYFWPQYPWLVSLRTQTAKSNSLLRIRRPSCCHLEQVLMSHNPVLLDRIGEIFLQRTQRICEMIEGGK